MWLLLSSDEADHLFDLEIGDVFDRRHIAEPPVVLSSAFPYRHAVRVVAVVVGFVDDGELRRTLVGAAQVDPVALGAVLLVDRCAVGNCQRSGSARRRRRGSAGRRCWRRRRGRRIGCVAGVGTAGEGKQGGCQRDRRDAEPARHAPAPRMSRYASKASWLKQTKRTSSTFVGVALTVSAAICVAGVIG